jgi:hypothetical protein
MGGMIVANQFKHQKLKIAYSWKEHKHDHHLGGEDYAQEAGKPVLACANGRTNLSNDGINGIDIVMANGWILTVRELVDEGDKYADLDVKIGDRIGTTGRVDGDGVVKWPHVDMTINGKRKRFTKRVTPRVVLAATGQFVKIQQPKERDMVLITHDGKSIWLVGEFTARLSNNLASDKKVWGAPIVLTEAHLKKTLRAVDARKHDLAQSMTQLSATAAQPAVAVPGAANK